MTVAVSELWRGPRLADWEDACATLHLWTQIVGKTRLALAPVENHWWQVALYVTARGLTTSPMPCGSRTFQVDFDFLEHQLLIRSSDGRTGRVELIPRSVASFYAEYGRVLDSLGFGTRIRPRPVEVPTAIPFPEDEVHASYDSVAVGQWWRLLAEADRVLKQFRGRFRGKQSPVHFFWGSFDLAATRFSGRPAPRHPGGAPNCPDYVMVEAYSAECSSVGFWPGSGTVSGPAFYAYAYPEPPGYADFRVAPAAAYYDGTFREFILPCEALADAKDPERELLEFMQSTWVAAADLGDWGRKALEQG